MQEGSNLVIVFFCTIGFKSCRSEVVNYSNVIQKEVLPIYSNFNYISTCLLTLFFQPCEIPRILGILSRFPHQNIKGLI